MLDRSDTIEHRSYIEKCAETGEFKYKCEFLVGKFAPTDFKIKLKGSMLTIDATHESPNTKTQQQIEQENFYYDNDDTYTMSTYLGKETQRFVREIQVPDFVNADSLQCYLETYDGFQNVLVVEGLVDERSEFDKSFTPVAKNTPVYSSRNAKSDLNIEAAAWSSSKIHFDPSYKGSTQNMEGCGDRVSSDTFLKYKFDLSDFEAKNIQITIRDKAVLNVSAVRDVIDERTGKSSVEHFDHDIKLPENVEIHNIKNCFDENDGILRIEIPLKEDHTKLSNKEKSRSSNNINSDRSRSRDSSLKTTTKRGPPQDDDKYLELVFDLYDFKFDRIDVKDSAEGRNKVLLVRAYKSEPNSYRPYLRKYILPEWVDCEKIYVSQDRQYVDGELKNVLIVQISIKD